MRRSCEGLGHHQHVREPRGFLKNRDQRRWWCRHLDLASALGCMYHMVLSCCSSPGLRLPKLIRAVLFGFWRVVHGSLASDMAPSLASADTAQDLADLAGLALRTERTTGSTPPRPSDFWNCHGSNIQAEAEAESPKIWELQLHFHGYRCTGTSRDCIDFRAFAASSIRRGQSRA